MYSTMTKHYKEMQVLPTDENYATVFNALYLNGIKNIIEEEGSIKIYFREKEFVKLKKLRTFLIEKCSKTDWQGIYAIKEE